MAIDVSIYEGAPYMDSTSAAAGVLTLHGGNISTCHLVECRGIVFGEHDTAQQWFDASVEIHDHVHIYFDQGLFPYANYCFYNPIGYKDQNPADILQDLIRYQAGCSLGAVRKFPTRDQSTTNWSSSDLGGRCWAVLAEGTDQRDSEKCWTTTNAAELWLGFFATLDGLISSVKKITVNLWAVFQETGSADGLAFKLKPYHSATSGTPGLGTLIGISYGKYAVHHMAVADDLFVFMQVTWDKINLTKTQCESIELMIKAFRGYAGATPNSKWWLYTCDIDLFVESGGMSLVDSAKFNTLATYFSTYYTGVPYRLDGDFVEGTFDQAVMKVIAHAPEMIVFLDSGGLISCARWPKFAGTSTLTIGPAQGNFRGIEKTGALSEFLRTETIMAYDSKLNEGQTTTPGVIDPENDLGVKNFIDEEDRWRKQEKQETADVTRELFRDQEVATYFMKNNRKLFSAPIDFFEIAVDATVLIADLASVVKIDIPDVGLNAQEMLVVAKEIDLDEMTGSITVFNRDFDPDA